jgi:hypothetical protein
VASVLAHLPRQRRSSRRVGGAPWVVTAGVAATLALAATPAHAADEDDDGGEEASAEGKRQLSADEIGSWLDSPAGKAEADKGPEDPDEPPPPPPRHHGFVLSSSVGALGHIGPLKHVSPMAPWFQVSFGFEPVSFLMLFVSSDVAISNTSYAYPPPAPRTYALAAFGGGVRLTVKPGDFGIYAQGDVGGSLVSEDVLLIYGYEDSDQLGAYFGGDLGFEWYQVNPHYALAVHGGVRDYPRLGHSVENQPPLAWLGGVTLRYTF